VSSSPEIRTSPLSNGLPTSAPAPLVSVIIPCRNEQRYMKACLDSILANDYPQDSLEIIVADGMSEDSTPAIVAEYERRYPFIRRVVNHRRITPVGLNLALAEAEGSVIVVMGAHALYAPDYISSLVSQLHLSGADAVGGVCITRPVDSSPMARAVAIGLSRRFGVGNAHFRVGSSKPRWVDTVPFGCYRRDVFERHGGFDEDLIRNQDDEFNLRLISRGGRILLLPNVVSHYFARGALHQLWRMYYQYGLFKPLVARKVGRILTVRQVIPPLFVGGLLVSGSLAPLSSPIAALFGLVVATYAAADLAMASSVARTEGLRCAAALSLVFPVLHVSYGLGFLHGMIRFLLLRRQRLSTVELRMSR
jgi:glycosyltransferase involved in cell wall biosynthesis